MRNLVVQNDQAVVDVNKPFQPFGALPKKNSSNFLIGNEEIFCKKWQAIDVNVLWKDLPTDFPDYYAGYPSPPSINNFTATVDLLSERNWLDRQPDNTLQLFVNDDTRIQKEGQPCCNAPAGFNLTHLESSWFIGRACLVLE